MKLMNKPEILKGEVKEFIKLVHHYRKITITDESEREILIAYWQKIDEFNDFYQNIDQIYNLLDSFN